SLLPEPGKRRTEALIALFSVLADLLAVLRIHFVKDGIRRGLVGAERDGPTKVFDLNIVEVWLCPVSCRLKKRKRNNQRLKITTNERNSLGNRICRSSDEKPRTIRARRAEDF